jgi:hypothetical protein
MVITPNEAGGYSTGAVVQFYDNSGALVKTYIVMLIGDVNGDGEYSGGDAVAIYDNGYYKTDFEYGGTNEEYKAALVRMRNFVEEESDQEDYTEEQGIGGHSLLGRNGKILVLGASALDQNTMNGIAKLYGFHKKDFEYETDYTKVVNFAGRINNSERYAAIIFGACPHKVAGLGDWSSIIEKCRQCEDMPCAFDARSHSGELKVTKESFKTALWNVCNELKLKKAV